MAFLEKYLRVKISTLPGAGKGLFTTIDIPKGKRFVEYKGRIQPWSEVKDDDGRNGYLMYINRYCVINAEPAIHTLGRYANDARGFVRIDGLSNNSEYVSVGRRCYIEAIRDIKAGEEIFVGYGTAYWGLQRKIARKKKKAAKKKTKRTKRL
ncbi:MAG: SET domain-containing protein-lysine N-methyltransferase [Cyclobacteriaceae bacterium]|nr:SET domain-containing protein-lysine N-methyltransferase [Cyclobacteriaceae bacterium]